ELVALLPVDVEARLLLVHVSPAPRDELAARHRRAPDGLTHLRVAEAEDLPEDERGPLERAEALQQEQRRDRHRLRELGRALRVRVRVLGEWLGHPGSDVALAADPRRA